MIYSTAAFLLLSGASAAFSASTCDSDCAQVLGLTNKYRAQEGLAPVCLNQKLMRTAFTQSQWQSIINKMTHDGPPGQETIGDRAKAQGYRYSYVGENVATGLTRPEAVVMGWWNSEGHKKNLLSDNLHMGLAYVEEGKFWTQVFGTPLYSGSESCDVGTVGGTNGFVKPTAAPRSLGPVPECGRQCNAALEILNRNRASIGISSICINDRLQRTAKASVVTVNPYTQKIESSRIEDFMADFGYGFQRYETRVFSSTATMSKEALEGLLEGKALSEFSHLGFAGTADGKMWLLLAAVPADPKFICSASTQQSTSVAEVVPIAEPDVECGATCQRVVSTLNSNRNKLGLEPLCWNRRVMATAEEQVLNMRIKVDMSALSSSLKTKGYDASNLSGYLFSMSYFGQLEDSRIERALMEQVSQVEVKGEFKHLGFAQYKSSGNVYWAVIVATSWSPSDTCSVASSSATSGTTYAPNYGIVSPVVSTESHIPDNPFAFATYGTPATPTYGVPTPTYGVPTPTYGVPTPTYGVPTPTYGVPTPTYGVPTPTYGLSPAPTYGGSIAPLTIGSQWGSVPSVNSGLEWNFDGPSSYQPIYPQKGPTSSYTQSFFFPTSSGSFTSGNFVWG